MSLDHPSEDTQQTMRLYMGAPRRYAMHVVKEGFIGRPSQLFETDDNGKTVLSEAGTPILGEVVSFCEFKDIPSSGLTYSRTTESEVTSFEDVDDKTKTVEVTVTGGPVLAEDPGDFTLVIEVPRDFALKREAKYDPPYGWSFREIWLTEDEANQFRSTLKVFDSGDDVEVPPHLVETYRTFEEKNREKFARLEAADSDEERTRIYGDYP